jgi:zinc transporter ZupT
MFPEAVEGFASFGEAYEKQAFIYFLVGIIIPFFVERILVPHSHSHSGLFHDTTDVPYRSVISVYLLMLMLSIHSFIEGKNSFAW